MNCRLTLSVAGVTALMTVAASLAIAQTERTPTKPPTGTTARPQTTPPGENQLPPGWTEADMQACIEAGTPGTMHEYLRDSIGVWNGKTTMWMGPGATPINSECTSTITDMMEGRFVKCEIAGEMPGMGPFKGFALYGYDNVGQKFQATWIDNHGTGMMIGTGELDSSGDTLTWNYTYNCPIAKKPVKMREVNRRTGKDTATLEMFGADPKSGKEYKMMEIALTRKPGTGRTASATPGTARPGEIPGGTVLMITDRTADAGCAHCLYHVSGVKECQVAVKIDGKTYLVTGAPSDAAHAYCTVSKPVVITGRIVDDRFIATKFETKP